MASGWRKEGAAKQRADLAAVAHTVGALSGLTRQDGNDLVDAVFKQISDALVAGEEVKVHGFATFTTRSKGARSGRNPKRPEQVITIEPRRVVMFRPAVDPRDRVD